MANNNPFSEIPTNTIMSLRQNRDIQDRQLNELKARIARLEEGIIGMDKSLVSMGSKGTVIPTREYQKMLRILKGTPRQSLNEIKANAIEEFIPTIKAMCDEPQNLKGRFQSELFWRGAFAVHDLGKEYANQLRNKDGI